MFDYSKCMYIDGLLINDMTYYVYSPHKTRRKLAHDSRAIMFSDTSLGPHEHAKGEHVIIPIPRCFLCDDKKHHVTTNGVESLLLRAHRYSRNLNFEIDHNVCRTVTSTGNSIIYQGILRPSGTHVAIKSIIRLRPDPKMVKVNSYDDLLSH